MDVVWCVVQVLFVVVSREDRIRYSQVVLWVGPWGVMVW